MRCCSQKAKIACKIRDEYMAVKDFKAPQAAAKGGALANGSQAAANGSAAPTSKDKSTTAKLIESMPAPADECVAAPGLAHCTTCAMWHIYARAPQKCCVRRRAVGRRVMLAGRLSGLCAAPHAMALRPGLPGEPRRKQEPWWCTRGTRPWCPQPPGARRSTCPAPSWPSGCPAHGRAPSGMRPGGCTGSSLVILGELPVHIPGAEMLIYHLFLHLCLSTC